MTLLVNEYTRFISSTVTANILNNYFFNCLFPLVVAFKTE